MTSPTDSDDMALLSSETIPLTSVQGCTKESQTLTNEDMKKSTVDETSPKTPNQTKTIGILGTGDYARALAKRLFFSGYDVIMGSRSPKTRQNLRRLEEYLCDVPITSLDICISRSDVLVAAMHMENFQITLGPQATSLAGKIVIDVSNRTNRHSSISNAEFLQSLCPDAIVVKAFNTVSAYVMEDTAAVKTHRVLVSSDYPWARERVKDVARDMGFTPVDMGGLRASRGVEMSVLKVFPGWKMPLVFTFGVFNLWMLYCLFIYFIECTVYSWEQVFLKVLNKPVCMTAVTILSVTYLPSSVAGIVQLYRGTKYRRFPSWLNSWLVSRRQLGLITLSLAVVHAAASAMMLSPAYYSSWFRQPVLVLPENLTDENTVLHLEPAWMVWKGELACLLGLVALLLLGIVGISSLPSVGATLNWAEWRLVQSKIGFFALMLALGHVLAMGAPEWSKMGWRKTFRSITFLSSLFPALTVFLRLFLALPLISSHLHKIRRGWERGATPEHDPSETCLEPKLKSILKNGSNGSSVSASNGTKPSSMKTKYTAVSVDERKYQCCCKSARNGHARGALPACVCDCSLV